MAACFEPLICGFGMIIHALFAAALHFGSQVFHRGAKVVPKPAPFFCVEIVEGFGLSGVPVARSRRVGFSPLQAPVHRRCAHFVQLLTHLCRQCSVFFFVVRQPQRDGGFESFATRLFGGQPDRFEHRLFLLSITPPRSTSLGRLPAMGSRPASTLRACLRS